MARKQVAVRVDEDALKRLESLGKQQKPMPLNRSDMINVAIDDYLRRNAPPKKQQPK